MGWYFPGVDMKPLTKILIAINVVTFLLLIQIWIEITV